MIVLQKVLTLLAMPTGLVWLGLIGLSLLAWRRRQKMLLAGLLVLWIVHTAAGNTPLGAAMMAWLERDYTGVRPADRGPFDAVVVLGGGTATGPNNRAQLGRAGDRLLVAARLYHAERTPRLVVTGDHIAEVNPGAGDPRRESAEILGLVSVPEDRIIQLPGRNTSEEMAAVAQWSGQHPEYRRLGLVTSAWHMPRAIRLAEARGLDLEPLPADFCGTPRQWTVLSIIPDAEGVILTQIALKEMLARLAGQ